jgi:hypothetical protein
MMSGLFGCTVLSPGVVPEKGKRIKYEKGAAQANETGPYRWRNQPKPHQKVRPGAQ